MVPSVVVLIAGVEAAGGEPLPVGVPNWSLISLRRGHYLGC